MFGPGLEIPDAKNIRSLSQKESNGIVIRACEEIFRAVEDRRKRHNIDAEIRMSYVEVPIKPGFLFFAAS